MAVQPMDAICKVLVNIGADDDRAVAYGDGIRRVVRVGPASLSLELVDTFPFGSDALTRMAIVMSPPNSPAVFVSYGFASPNTFNVAWLDAAGDPAPGGGSGCLMIFVRDLPLVNFDPPL